MKRLVLACFIAVVALAAVNIGPTPALADAHTETVTLRVDGMVCPLCEKTVESVLKSLGGVVAASADRGTRSAIAEYDPARVTPEQMVQAINSQTYYRAGIISENIKLVTLRIPGMTDQEKTQEVASALNNVEGIVGGTLQVEDVTLNYDRRIISPEQIVETINSRTSFTATVVSQGQSLTEGAATGPIATAVIKVQGMTDDKAASQVASALFLDGIIDGSVNLQDSTLTIKYDSSKVTADKIVETMEQSLPFAVSLVSVQKPGGSLIPSIVVGFGLAVVLLVGVWLFMRRTSGKGQPE